MTAYAGVKAWRKENPDKVAAQAARRRARSPEKFAAVSVKYWQKHKERLRPLSAERARKRRANDPEGQRRRMLEFKERQEKKRTEIAGRPRPSICDLCKTNKGGIVFDHCHKNGHFRGWLCDRCNKVLGLVSDDAKLLKKMAKYLEAQNGAPYLKAKELTPFGELRWS